MNRSEYRRSRAERKNHDDQRGWLLILMLLMLSGFLGYFLFLGKQAHRKLETGSLCPLKPLVTDSMTAVIIDMTDRMTVAQRQDFLNQLERLQDEIPQYGQLAIFAVASTEQELLSPITHLCNPGRGEAVNPWVGNPLKTEEKWRSGFKEPLTQAFDGIMKLRDAPYSPIMESIQSVSLTFFQSPLAQGRPRRLIIVSDLLQHTESFNFYKEIPEPSTVLQNPLFQSLRTDLHGIDVELWLLRRLDQPGFPAARLVTLWESILQMQGARVVRVYNISG